MTHRKRYLTLSIISFLICVLIVLLFSNHGFIRGFLGDLIIVIFLFFSIKLIYPFSNFALSLSVVIFAYCIEFTQYIKIIPLLGLKENIFTKIVFGSVFDPFDLLAYTVGGVISYRIGNKIEN
ncbi:MAG TPA: DUF2809 domain-containing protein [Leptospiraceae bacterium]|nr:DUF2809 domain-containing protein [Leptospiraceae bacterium]HMW08402.1 DUF2809 domain-containing protein [Leptospiraceae bacterium]HMX33684.1 DUF2809 domain-containing protein [Leptospiraceae bacterium]HMY34101.1 DUF2809 domain-containing protein [Leptospiraceae bacterium]HMZ65965.1 DUF2809 domain-containing protein [Leptospiraceae bacterium]